MQKLADLVYFAKRILRFDSGKVLVSIILTLISGAFEGVGLLLLLPLLEFAKNGTGSAATIKYKIVANFFQLIHFRGTLIEILLIYVIVVSAVALLNYAKNRFNGVLQLRFAYSLQQELYTALLASPWLTIANTKRSDFSQLLTREISIVSGGISMLTQVFNLVVFTCIYLVISSFISWRITLCATVFGTLIYAILHYQSHLAHVFGKNCYSFFQKLYSAINDHLVGAKLAKTYGLEKKLQQHFQTITQEIVRQGAKFINLQAANSLFYTISSAVMFSIVFYYAISKLHIALTTLVVLLIIFARLATKLSTLQQLYQYLLNYLPSFQAVETALQRFPCKALTTKLTQVAPIQLEQAVVLQHIAFAYAAQGDVQEPRKVFTDLNLTIPAKQIMAIVGSSGSGKSTLIDLIIGLLTPAAGEILVDGKPLIAAQIPAWQKAIAYVPQDDFLLNDTIKNNLLWVNAAVTDAEIDAALQMANIYEFVQQLPQKLATIVGDNGVCLSGGERQRIMLARALLRKPSVLILDEATSALDQANEAIIFDTLRKLHHQMTIIIVTHRMTVKDLADEIFVMPDAQIT